jgi:hypothetical protein
MKKVYQQLAQTETPDCMRACIASIFEKDLDDVPNLFNRGASKGTKIENKILWTGWMDNLINYCVGLGTVPQFYHPSLYKKGEYSMIGVTGYHDNKMFSHSLVMFERSVVHCPSEYWDESRFPFPMDINEYSKVSGLLHTWTVLFSDKLSLRKEMWLKK